MSILIQNVCVEPGRPPVSKAICQDAVLNIIRWSRFRPWRWWFVDRRKKCFDLWQAEYSIPPKYLQITMSKVRSWIISLSSFQQYSQNHKINISSRAWCTEEPIELSQIIDHCKWSTSAILLLNWPADIHSAVITHFPCFGFHFFILKKLYLVQSSARKKRCSDVDGPSCCFVYQVSVLHGCVNWHKAHIRSSRFKYNASTVNYLLVFVYLLT